MRIPSSLLITSFLPVALMTSMARGDDVSPPGSAPPAPAPAPAPAPPPYSLPWQLRPAAPVSVVRSDTAIASFAAPSGERGTTVASTLLGSFKITPHFAPLIRLAWVHLSPPAGDSGSALVNPLVGVTWGMPLTPELRLALFGAVTVPVGQGGGNAPDKTAAAARAAGIPARSGMDNALFAVNDFTPIGGVDLAWVASGLTVQAEATVFELIRVRGADAQPDSTKTNFTSGLHVGYFVAAPLSLGAELRYQRWLSTPVAVEKDPTGASRDQMTFAIGARAHIPLGSGMWLRPGIAYAQAIDDPMAAAKYRIVQVDVPFAF